MPTLMVCPYCKELIPQPNTTAIKVFMLGKFQYKTTKEIATQLNKSERYIRRLKADFRQLCPKCQERILPTTDEWRLIFLRSGITPGTKWNGRWATLDEIAHIEGISVYKLRKRLKEIETKYGPTISYLRAFAGDLFPGGSVVKPKMTKKGRMEHYAAEPDELPAKPRHPKDGYKYQYEPDENYEGASYDPYK